MDNFKSVDSAIAIIAISFSDGTYQTYMGEISEIETYRENDSYF